MSMNPQENNRLNGLFLLALLVVAAIAFTANGSIAKVRLKSKAIAQGQVLYSSNCQSCHRQGTNPLKPENQLAESTKLVSQLAFKDYLSSKHGMMPNFQSIASKNSELGYLYEYVKTLSNQSWEYPQSEPQPQDPPMKDNAPKSGSD